MFERYLADGEPRGLSLLEWVESPAYDHDRIRVEFDASGWKAHLADRLLRRE